MSVKCYWPHVWLPPMNSRSESGHRLMKKEDLIIIVENTDIQYLCPFCKASVGKLNADEYYCRDVCKESRKSK